MRIDENNYKKNNNNNKNPELQKQSFRIILQDKLTKEPINY